ncbi:TPA: hypothetical protein NKU35_004000 [Vibrio parahaemolyticus]|nr:hypothetical protein [Vibrio parahaemolyticus]HCH3386250.1 hypothetical protein [Vibrio parahaemolyticus]HCH5494928.1 hypothetical protein [Vibrio parahaemolyticus]HCH5889241.1 hypothetical protein [Vibrio parahaemolyticus]HCH6276303.1 hypothetical protein [Vibrio parahaemolyticus]
MKIELQENEYLSDLDCISRDVGIHLIKAGTGVGKTTYMMSEASKSTDIVVFSMKSIMAQQIASAWRKKQRCNVIQLEHLVDMSADDIVATVGESGALHLDEIQNIYEADYRSGTFSKLVDLLNVLRARVRIYCYSGTFIDELSAIKFDSVLQVNKQAANRQITAYVTTTKSGSDSYYGISNKTIVEFIRLDLNKTVLFFNNNHKMNSQLAQLFSQQGISAVTVNRDSIEDENHAIHKLIETECISSMNAQVVLTTCSLEEGINIKDEVRICAVANAAERAVQQFGRCRNAELGSFDLLIGGGDKLVQIERVKEKANALSTQIDDLNDGNRFDVLNGLKRYGVSHNVLSVNHDFRSKVIARAMQAQKYCSSSYGLGILLELEKYGYEVTDVYDVTPEDGSLLLGTVTKGEIIDVLRKLKTVAEVAEQRGLHEAIVRSCVDKALRFRGRFQQLEIKYGCSDWLHAFEKLTLNELGFLMEITDAQARFLGEQIAANSIKSRIERINKQQYVNLVHDFWHKKHFEGATEWYPLDDTGEYVVTAAQKRLFNYLTGWESVRGGEYVRSSDIVFDWQDALNNAQRNRFNARKKHIERVTEVSTFCTQLELKRSEVADMSTKDVKNKLAEVNW